jgi:hypothetical protein
MGTATMSNAQDANRRTSGVVQVPEARTQARAPRLDSYAQAAIVRSLRNTYAELLKAALPKQLTDLIVRLHQAQEAKPNDS